MVKGELKKRIDAMKYIPSGAQEFGEEMVDASDFKTVIDEAKKEFPEKPEGHLLADKQTLRIWAWFEKWFGES